MRYTVAPRAGAWIETADPSLMGRVTTSHPVRVRGLKQEMGHVEGSAVVAHRAQMVVLGRQAQPYREGPQCKNLKIIWYLEYLLRYSLHVCLY